MRRAGRNRGRAPCNRGRRRSPARARSASAPPPGASPLRPHRVPRGASRSTAAPGRRASSRSCPPHSHARCRPGDRTCTPSSRRCHPCPSSAPFAVVANETLTPRFSSSWRRRHATKRLAFARIVTCPSMLRHARGPCVLEAARRRHAPSDRERAKSRQAQRLILTDASRSRPATGHSRAQSSQWLGSAEVHRPRAHVGAAVVADREDVEANAEPSRAQPSRAEPRPRPRPDVCAALC